MTAPSWEVARVLDGKITWDDFSLTFRMRLNREPDIYHTVVQGFLRLEPEDMNWFCERLLAIETNQERIVVEANGTRYAVDRYCPHQGGDLQPGWVEEGRFLTCARHQWQFDLENDGSGATQRGERPCRLSRRRLMSRWRTPKRGSDEVTELLLLGAFCLYWAGFLWVLWWITLREGSPPGVAARPHWWSADTTPEGFAVPRPLWVAPSFLLLFAGLSAAIVPLLSS